jgi:hypothetical protein
MKRLSFAEWFFYAAFAYFVWYQMYFYNILAATLPGVGIVLCASAAAAIVFAVSHNRFQRGLVVCAAALILIISLLWVYTLRQEHALNRQFNIETRAGNDPQEVAAGMNRQAEGQFALEKFNASAVFWIALIFGLALALANTHFRMKPLGTALAILSVFLGSVVYSVLMVVFLGLAGRSFF